MKKFRVGILGATGMVGQRFIQLLEHHPWFEVVALAASERSAGKSYAEAVNWKHATSIPARLAEMKVVLCMPQDMNVDFVFSALDSDVAGQVDLEFAKGGIPVVSTAKNYRMDCDVPMIIPEINGDHLQIISHQKQHRGFDRGFIAVKPNCSIQSYLIALFPLHRQFRMKRAIITTMQAVSGAGYPGVASLDILDNIVPFISGEEEKSEREPLKILGDIVGSEIRMASDIVISAHCNRVPVVDGHLATISVEFEKEASREEILTLWKEFRAEPQTLRLPSAPDPVIIYREEDNRPQTRLDRDAGEGLASGMAVVCGRLRPCNVFDWRFVCLSHNTIRGAAGGAILLAELLKEKGNL